MADPYGVDLSTFPDLSLTRTVSGRRNRAEALARRLITPPDSLPMTEGYGLDTREWLNDGADAYVWLERATLVEQEIEKDPYILEASVTAITPAGGKDALDLTITVEDEIAGQFTLELSVNRLRAEVTNVSDTPKT